MTDDITVAKLGWQCRRGMLELDVILEPFLNQHFAQLTAEMQALFERLLKEADPDLYTWLMGFGQAADPELQQMVKLIREQMKIE